MPAFVSAGASVILGDLNPVQLRGVAWLKAEFTDQTQVPGLVNEVIHTSGSIDALISLVGTSPWVASPKPMCHCGIGC